MTKLCAYFKQIRPQTWVFIALASMVVVFDQITKWLAVKHLTYAFSTTTSDLTFCEKLDIFLWHEHPMRASAVAVIDNFWHFRYVENPGAAWGFLHGAADWFRTPFFLTISLLAMAFIVVYFRRTTSEQALLRVALGLVFGGAIGNFLDRVRLGYVIDFIDWHWYDKATWPTFNIADAGITVGVCLMVLEMIIHRQNPADPAKK